jgi:hypothetical protein
VRLDAVACAMPAAHSNSALYMSTSNVTPGHELQVCLCCVWFDGMCQMSSLSYVHKARATMRIVAFTMVETRKLSWAAADRARGGWFRRRERKRKGERITGEEGHRADDKIPHNSSRGT